MGEEGGGAQWWRVKGMGERGGALKVGAEEKKSSGEGGRRGRGDGEEGER